MGSSHRHATGFSNKCRVNIRLTDRHISAIFTVEDQRKLGLIADAQQNQRCQPLGIGHDTSGIDPLPLQLLNNEPAHMFITNAGDQG